MSRLWRAIAWNDDRDLNRRAAQQGPFNGRLDGGGAETIGKLRWMPSLVAGHTSLRMSAALLYPIRRTGTTVA